jgi:hypothetical protein
MLPLPGGGWDVGRLLSNGTEARQTLDLVDVFADDGKPGLETRFDA